MAGVWAKKLCGKPTKPSPGFHTQVLLLRALSPVGNSFTSLGSLPVRNRMKNVRESWTLMVQNSPSLGREQESLEVPLV